MTLSSVVVLPVRCAAALVRYRRRHRPQRDEFLRTGGGDHELTPSQAALRGGGKSAWMRFGGGSG